jgi:RNA polymerase sigma-70 factor (ECF subfamily)
MVLRFQAGDEAAYDELVLRHRRPVYRLAYRLTGNHAEADDVSQEVFLRAFRGLRRFRGDASFLTWITRIVVNVAFNARQARRPEVPLEEAVAGPTPQPGAEAAMLRGQVRQAVQCLPPRQRQVLILKVYEGLKFVEIAAAAGMSVGTAKATFFQAVRRLRQRLGVRSQPQPIEEEVGG